MAAASFPCFVMLLARPELVADRPELVTNRRATVLHLEAFTADEMAQLVDGLVQGLPVGVRDQLVERAEGIATYAVETVRALIDRDLVVPRGGAYVLQDPEALDLAEIGAPASLQALISARLDRLDADQRRVVDRASVAGGSVEPSLLAELCLDIPDLDVVLAALVRAQILAVEHDRLSSEQGRYQFVQSALRQVAYATLSRRDRKLIHLQMLEAVSRDGSEERAPVAAQHCIAAIEAAPDDGDASDLAARAVGFLQRAAARANALGAPIEAVGHLARAADLATGDRQRHEIRLAEADACVDAGLYERGLTLAEEARQGFEALGDADHAALAAAAWTLAVARGSGDLHAGIAKIEPYLTVLQEQAGKDAVLAPVLYAYLLAARGTRAGEYTLLLQAIKVADRLGDRAQVARGYNNLSVQVMREGHEELGITLLEKSTAVARECHDLGQLSSGLSNLASALAQRDTAAAARAADESLETARRAGVAAAMSNALVNVAIGRWATGEWDGVLEQVQAEWVAAADEAVVALPAALVLVARGVDPADLVEGVPEAQDTVFYRDAACALTQMFAGDRSAVATAPRMLDDAYAISGIFEDFTLFYGAAVLVAERFEDAELFDHLRRIVDDDGSTPPAGLAGHRALVRALAPVDGDDAEAGFRAALAHYEAWGSRVHRARAQAAYGTWLMRNGRITEAEPLVAEARTTYASLGAVAWLDDLERVRSRVVG
jgi:hypothetical protein